MSRIDEAMRLAREGTTARVAESDAPRSPQEDAVPTQWTEDGDESPAFADPPRAAEPPARPPAPFAAPSTGMSGGSTMALFRGFNPGVLERLIAGTKNTMLTEQYRQLAATLHHAQIAQQIRSVMLASDTASEGKTLTATNLALTLSESYRRRVLLIDADLRRPSLHDVFQVPNVSGLNEGLQAASERKLSLLQITSTLTLLPAGRPNPDPMSSLTSDRMREILREATACFDWVLVDTPPVALMADANILAAMVDAALLVVRARHTPYPLVEKTIEAIGRDRILGVVLNDADVQEIHSDYYSYRGYGSNE
jgi:capsular exopolysaccharide synthesis family protein